MANRIVAFLIDHMIICFAWAFLGFAQMLIKTDLLWLWRMYYILLLAFLFDIGYIKLCTIEMN